MSGSHYKPPALLEVLDFYVRASGWALIEDYEKMKFIAKKHNTIVAFINRSLIENIKESKEYRGLQSRIDALKRESKTHKDKNRRIQSAAAAKETEKQLEGFLEEAAEVHGVGQWVVDGFSEWVDTFMPNAIYLHLYPFDDYEQFHIKANLKPDRFVDGDRYSTDFAYGARPNVKLSVLGLLTSIPHGDGHPFDPMKEFNEHQTADKKDDPIGFEAAIRGIFRGFEGMDRLAKFDRYPNVTIYPLAVFRDIYPGENSCGG